MKTKLKQSLTVTFVLLVMGFDWAMAESPVTSSETQKLNINVGTSKLIYRGEI